MLDFCCIMEYAELVQVTLFGSAVLLLAIVFKRKRLFTADFTRLFGCQPEKRNGRKGASLSTKRCEDLSGSCDGVAGKECENTTAKEVVVDIEGYDPKEDESRKADEDDKETIVELNRDVEDREQGIFHLHDVEEHQGDVEKTYIGTDCEEEKTKDVKKSTWKGSLWSLNRASQKSVTGEDEKKSTWKGSLLSLRRVSPKIVTNEGEEDGKWKGSLWSLMSLSKESDSFKDVVFDSKASFFYDVKGKWEKLGYGNLIISLDTKRRAELEMLDGAEQVIRHPVRRETQLVPAKGTNRAYVWTTEAYLKRERKAKKITLFVRFPEAHTAYLFQKEFHTAQSEATHSKTLLSRKKKNKGKMKEVSEERKDTISLDSRYSVFGGDSGIVDFEEYEEDEGWKEELGSQEFREEEPR